MYFTWINNYQNFVTLAFGFFFFVSGYSSIDFCILNQLVTIFLWPLLVLNNFSTLFSAFWGGHLNYLSLHIIFVYLVL